MDSFVLSEHSSMIQWKCSDTFNSSCATKIKSIHPLKAELKPICHLLALLEAHRILHISGIRVNGTLQGWLIHKDCSPTAFTDKQPVAHTCTVDRGLLKLKYYMRVDRKLHIIANLYVSVPSSVKWKHWNRE
jgi:hypothetical protein